MSVCLSLYLYLYLYVYVYVYLYLYVVCIIYSTLHTCGKPIQQILASSRNMLAFVNEGGKKAGCFVTASNLQGH